MHKIYYILDAWAKPTIDPTQEKYSVDRLASDVEVQIRST